MTRLARSRAQRRRPAEPTGTGFTRVVEAIAAPVPTYDGFVGYPMTGRKAVRR